MRAHDPDDLFGKGLNMRNVVQCVTCAAFALVVFCGCGVRLDVAPSAVSDDREYVDVEDAALKMVDKEQVVRIRLALSKELPSDLLYDVVTSQAGGDVVVKKDVPTNIDGKEPGTRKIDIPVEEALRGGKIVFHLAAPPASQRAPASQPES